MEYRPFVTSIENLSPTPTFSDLKAKLLMYEQRTLFDDGSKIVSDNSSVAALNTQLQSVSLSQPSLLPTPQISSYVVSSSGSGKHNSSSSTPNSNGKHSSNGSRNKCQICHKFGHSAAKCRYTYSQSRNNGTTNHFAGFHNQQTHHASGTPSVASWIPDTSASSHMTADSSLLHQLQPYRGLDQVVVGDGTPLNISNTGPPHRDSSSQGPY